MASVWRLLRSSLRLSAVSHQYNSCRTRFSRKPRMKVSWKSA
ncbi:MAG: hypothetical protein KBG84_12275 [Planctomycetes bacterium]|nr:hypothetical protein [Planctomycetota bacterium]